MNRQILVIDDQVSFCHHIRGILEGEGYRVGIADSPGRALNMVSSENFDVLLSDMKMPEMDGLRLFRAARKIDPELSGIIMTAYGSIASAVSAIKEGVSDYLQKPFEPDALIMVVERTLKERQLLQEVRSLRKEVGQKYAFGNIVGKDHKMQKIYDIIKRVSQTDSSVFITGETGVGKELVAKAIHFNSPRKNRPFVPINCGALTESLLESELFGHEKGAFTHAVHTKLGKFEYAQGGTLFLDEVGNITPAMQVKLLRVLQERKIERVGGNQPISVDIRVISATNQDMNDKVGTKEFRMDLLYRINVIPIHIPPLRERIEDIPLLVDHFMRLFNKNLKRNITRVSPRAMEQLMRHQWPGNVRELENVLERAYVVTDGDVIDEIILSNPLQESPPARAIDVLDTDIPFLTARNIVVRRFERAYVFEALKRYDGNVMETARRTGINPRTLWRKIKEYNLPREKFRAGGEM